MRVVITGGAGFVGSHLCDALIARGDRVVVFDNFSTGRPDNVEHLLERGPQVFWLDERDVCDDLYVPGNVDAVIHMASPASPPAYTKLAIETLRAGSLGTENALKLAARKSARFILASTSEVYGDPLEHPQMESYWGNVNPIGARSMYDESKRYAEAITAAYYRDRGVNAGIVRIFNTAGPRMRADDGRVVTNFIVQALSGLPLTVYGGNQTRSFCYISDMVDGLVKMIDSGITGPINIGNNSEFKISELARIVARITGTKLWTVQCPVPPDDPRRRCPDISMAARALDWRPKVALEQGLRQTIEWFREHPLEVRRAARQWDAAGDKRWLWGKGAPVPVGSVPDPDPIYPLGDRTPGRAEQL